VPGRAIVWSSWLADALLAATAVPVAVGATVLEGVAIAVALTLFAVSIPVWVYALGRAAVRSARGDDVVVASLFFLQGSAPRRVQVHLMASLGASIAIAAATASAAPFGVLVPMLPLGLAGLWGARHGTYPPRARRDVPDRGVPERRASG
jgi:hypothetical protein